MCDRKILSPRHHWRKSAYLPNWISSPPFCMPLGTGGADPYGASRRIARSAESETQLWFHPGPKWIYARGRLPSCPRNRYCFRFRSVSFRAYTASSSPLQKQEHLWKCHLLIKIFIFFNLIIWEQSKYIILLFSFSKYRSECYLTHNILSKIL